jgi:hypothetical protein
MLLLFLSCGFSKSFQPSYSLEKPFKSTFHNELGNWSLRGSALPMRNFIRLTTPAANTSGAVCHRIPTTFRDWSIDVELNAWGGTGGDGFWIIYSSHFCPDPLSSIDGISVWIDTQGRIGSPVYINRDEFREELCRVQVRSDEHNLRLRIERNDTAVTVSHKKGRCGQKVLPDLPVFGYLTVAAQTGFNWGDDHDVYEIRTEAVSRVITMPGRRNYSHENRKVLEGMRNSRLPGMPYTSKYLRKPDEAALSDALRIVNETIQRAGMAVSKQFIEKFTNAVILMKIMRAQEAIEFAAENFSE